MMNGFFWASPHLGWGIFSLLVFTALWLLLTDLVWRLKDIRIRLLLAMMAVGWVIGAVLIVAAFCLHNG